MSEKIKVSELQESTTTNDDDLIMIVQGNGDNELENFKQTRANFFASLSGILTIKELTENLAITTGNTPSLAEGYYYTGSYNVTVNGTNIDNLDNSIFYLNKSISGVDFAITKIWGSGTGYPYVSIDKFTGDDEINVIERAPLTSNQLVTSISSSSTNNQIPSAKCVYDIVGDIGTALDTIQGEVI